LLSKNRLDRFFIHAFLNLPGLLAVLLFILEGFALADMDRQEGGLAARPQLALVVLGNGERLDKGDPSVDRGLDEVTQVAIHDEFKPKNHSPKQGLLVLFSAFFVEVMAFGVAFALAESVLDFTDQEVAPPVEHVRLEERVGGCLLLLHLLQLVWQLHLRLVCVDVPLVLEFVDVLVGEDFSHFAHVCVRAPVLVQDVVLLFKEGVLRAADDAEVGISALVQTNRHFELDEALVVIWVLHFFDDNALFHLPDVLFLDDSH